MRYTNASPLWRRLHRGVRSLFRPDALRKRHTVHIVRIGKRRFKQVRFAHASEAKRVEHNLRQVKSLARFPEFVYRRDSTVWVTFFDGERLDSTRPGHVDGLIAFFADLYRLRPRLVETAETGIHDQLLEDLSFLGAVGQLSEATVENLTQTAGRLMPSRVWVGFEYIDALRKNFVVIDDRPVGIDIESLHADQLLGIGIAKARHRWLELPDESLPARLAALGAPDLRAQYAYASLSFLASYAKQDVFRGKAGRVRSGHFERLVAQYAG